MIDLIKRAKNYLAKGEQENITVYETKHFFLYLFLLISFRNKIEKFKQVNLYSIIHYNYKKGQTKCFQLCLKPNGRVYNMYMKLHKLQILPKV